MHDTIGQLMSHKKALWPFAQNKSIAQRDELIYTEKLALILADNIWTIAILGYFLSEKNTFGLKTNLNSAK